MLLVWHNIALSLYTHVSENVSFNFATFVNFRGPAQIFPLMKIFHRVEISADRERARLQGS